MPEILNFASGELAEVDQTRDSECCCLILPAGGRLAHCASEVKRPIRVLLRLGAAELRTSLSTSQLHFSFSKIYALVTVLRHYIFVFASYLALLTMSSAPLRRFQCTNGTCTESFTRNANLQAHISGKHLGLKPFKCSMCDEAFVRNSDRIKHDNTVHKLIRSFCCEAEGCKKAYATRFQLNRHLRKFPGHTHVKRHPRTIEGTEELIERLAEEIEEAVEEAVEYCDKYSVVINLHHLYATIANHFRRLRQPQFDSLVQELKSMMDEMITHGTKERDREAYELRKMFHVQWREFDELRGVSCPLDQRELEVVEHWVPTPEIWHDLLRLHERTERDRMCEEYSQMHGIDDERSTSTEEEDRLFAAAVDDHINTLVQEQLQTRSPKLSLDWVKGSLRAAFAAHEFCKSVQSGHTNSTMESVRISSLAGSAGPELLSEPSPRFFCRDSDCELDGFSDYECYKTHMGKCHPSFRIEHSDVEEPLHASPEYTGNAEYGAGRNTRDRVQDQSLERDEMNYREREWGVKAKCEEYPRERRKAEGALAEFFRERDEAIKQGRRSLRFSNGVSYITDATNWSNAADWGKVVHTKASIE